MAKRHPISSCALIGFEQAIRQKSLTSWSFNIILLYMERIMGDRASKRISLICQWFTTLKRLLIQMKWNLPKLRRLSKKGGIEDGWHLRRLLKSLGIRRGLRVIGFRLETSRHITLWYCWSFCWKNTHHELWRLCREGLKSDSKSEIETESDSVSLSMMTRHLFPLYHWLMLRNNHDFG
jgi:hypothetical protein